MSRVSVGRVVGVCAAVAMTAAACGGGPSLDGPIPGVDLGDLGIVIEEGDDGISVDIGDFTVRGDTGEAQFGQDLPRPAWVPADFRLPDGLRIEAAVRDDLNRQGSLTGTVDGGAAESVAAAARSALLAGGYEVLTEAPGFLYVVKEGVGGVTISVSEAGTAGAHFSATFDFGVDVAEERLRYAEAVVGPGTAMAVVEGRVFEAAGECRVQGHSHGFDAEDASISLQIDTSMTPTYVIATIATFSADEQILYSMNSMMEGAGAFEVTTSPTRFSVSGTMNDVLDAAADPLTVSITVDCGGA